MSGTASRLDDFYDSYRTAFERLDVAAIAEHFTFPLHLAGDDDQLTLFSVASREVLAARLERLLGMYRAIHFGSARVGSIEPTEISPRLLLARVHWELHNLDGRPLYDFEVCYTLAEIEGALKITAIAHAELPRYRACLARLQG